MPNEQAGKSADNIQWRIVPAAIIVGIGVLFLANNLGYHWNWFEHGNWWALIILLAGIAPLTRAWELYRERGRVDGAVAHQLISTLAFVLVASMFLFDLDWGVWWPLFVILGGLFALVPHRDRCRGSRRWQQDEGSFRQ